MSDVQKPKRSALKFLFLIVFGGFLFKAAVVLWPDGSAPTGRLSNPILVAIEKDEQLCSGENWHACLRAGKALEGEVARVYWKRCTIQHDDCTKAGAYIDEARQKEAAARCQTGIVEECMLQAGKEWSLGNRQLAQNITKKACENHSWFACTRYGWMAGFKETPRFVSACRKGDNIACLAAVGALYDDHFDQAKELLQLSCRRGDQRSCRESGIAKRGKW